MSATGFDRRDLRMLASLTRMSLSDRYLGSTLGIVWAVLSPLVLLSIFTFVFAFVFPGRLPGRDGRLPFIIWLISGYGPWLALSEGLSLATASVIGNAGLVKNIAFKSELLPLVGSLIGLVPFAVSFVLILMLKLLGSEWPHPVLLVLPYVVALQFVFVSGLGLFLSALNVFVRDTQLILPNVLTLALFASPIFYAITSYPQALQGILALNPFYVLAECYRAPILNDQLPAFWMLAYLTLISGLVFIGGLWWFRRLKTFFDTRL